MLASPHPAGGFLLGFRTVATLAAVTVAHSAAVAQSTAKVTLRGTVVDADSRAPIFGAFVGPVGGRTGVLTDSLGRFALPLDRASTYPIQISQLGYHPLQATLPAEAEHRAFTVGLKPDPIELKGLVAIVDQLATQRSGPLGAATILRQEDLLRSGFGSAYGLTRQVLPFARLCSHDADSLCVSGQGQSRPVAVCIDGRRVSSGSPEMQAIDPHSLYLVEAYPRVGRIRFYTRGYIARLAANGRRLPPPTFECVGPG